ncbi:MAG: HAMP domain-containing histidine kinase [Candidatus Omnitrophica bacterium]|nr:HAMP domain-containing histidine kinase [Candidatus Omnitrophota bacterium]MBI2173738.1 HAMP domain-containing histidine kinase [Candidatus Omnitrophota bacterium]
MRYSILGWYVGVLALILCLFSAALYGIVWVRLSRAIDRTLVLKAEGLAGSIYAFWSAERSAVGSGPGNWTDAPSPTLESEVWRGRFVDLLSRWAQSTGQLDAGGWVQLTDRSGRSLGASTQFAKLGLSLSQESLDAAQTGQIAYETIQLPQEHYRLLAHPVMEQGRVLYIVLIADSLEQVDEFLRQLRNWLLVLAPLALLLTSLVGWLLTNAAMEPVSQMIEKAQRIGSGHLHERIEVPKTGDEVERLAATFNEMLERVEQMVKRMRQFSAAASHELRTPLTIMQGELELLLRREREAEEYKRVLQVQLDTVKEMTHTVEQLLMLARSEVVDGALEWRSVELSSLVHEVMRTLKTPNNGNRCELLLNIKEPVLIQGEPHLLTRLLTNLIDNAIRYTPATGHITVRVDAVDTEACLCVEDTGKGIPPEEMPHIFDRFFKPTLSASPHSTGLGLGLCRWIAEVHHGRLDVSSYPEQGTRVTLWLPRLR